eukprot:scaffold70578_cov63-Phaeocystis_antarctica.AAC.1
MSKVLDHAAVSRVQGHPVPVELPVSRPAACPPWLPPTSCETKIYPDCDPDVPMTQCTVGILYLPKMPWPWPWPPGKASWR